MKIMLDEATRNNIARHVELREDAEATGDGVVLDIYDSEPPITMECVPLADGVDVLAAAVLRYDEEMDGYYVAERVEDAAVLREALAHWEVLA